MKFRWITARSINRGEVDFEPWFLFASTAFAGGCLAWLSLGLPWPKCWIRHLLGFPCPTCGSTRSALAFVHGNLIAAFHDNPLMTLVYLSVLGFDLYAVAVLVLRTKRLRLTAIPLQVQRVLGVIAVGAVILNWIYLLCYLR